VAQILRSRLTKIRLRRRPDRFLYQICQVPSYG
jgi:hypothetical protein